MRARIEFFSPAVDADDIGGGAQSFVSVDEVWAQIMPLGASEGAGFDGDAALSRYRAVVRMRRDVAPGWKLGWGARTLRVVTLTDADAAGAFLALTCEEEFL